ncbi:unnamed protein product [Heterobilharzia americana]|nr:unnamed protein product [Heterobilharzia americana]
MDPTASYYSSLLYRIETQAISRHSHRSLYANGDRSIRSNQRRCNTSNNIEFNV